MRALKGAATRARKKKQLDYDVEGDPSAMERRKRSRKRRKKNPAGEEWRGHRKAHRRAAKKGWRRRKARRAAPRRTHRRRPGHRRHRVRGYSYTRRGKRVRVRGHMSHEERRRHKRRNPRRRRAREERRHPRRRNPINGWQEMLAGVFGVAAGYVIASGGDRFVATHALNAAGQDAPVQGDIYNSEAISLPLWSSWSRLGVAVLSVGAPLVIAANVRSAAWKSFFQLAGFGALARTAGKAADDGIAALAGAYAPGNTTLVRLYAPEMAALTAVSASAVTAPAAATAGTFAGLPGIPRLGQLAPGYVAPTATPAGEGRVAWSCPQGYTLTEGGCQPPDGGTTLPPAVTATKPVVPPETTTPPVTTPPSGGGGGGAAPPVTTTPVVPVTPPATTPFNPLLVHPCPDVC